MSAKFRARRPSCGAQLSWPEWGWGILPPKLTSPATETNQAFEKIHRFEFDYGWTITTSKFEFLFYL